MKKTIFIIGLLLGVAQAQSTTITGTIKDLTGANVTSGKVTFTLQPSRDTTISGTARFSPLQVVCLINGSGQIVALDGVSACTVTTNTSLQPTGSYYRVDVWPGNVKTSSFNFYAVNASYDWSTVVPTPTTSPADNFVDVFSNQTIGGNKTWTGTHSFQGATFGANISVFSLNNVLSMDGVKYPCTTSGLQQILSDAVAAGGGIVDAGFCSTLSLTSATTIGSASQSVALLLPNHGVWSLSGITDGTSCFLKIMSGSSILAQGMSNGGGNKLTFQNGGPTVNADSIICTDPSPIGGGSYIRIEGGFLLYNPAGTPGTYVNGLLHVQKVFDASVVRDVAIANTNGIGMYVKGACCAATFEKLEIDGQGGAGAAPVVIDGGFGAGTAAVAFINLSADHAGPGQHEIEVKGSPGFIGTINFYNTYVEGANAAGSTAHIEITASQQGVNFYGGAVAIENASDTGYCFDAVSASGNELGVYGFACQYAGVTHAAINDHNTGITLASDATGSVPSYQTSVGIFARSYSFMESTPGGAGSGLDVCSGDTSSHTLKCSYNNGSFFSQTQTIASGTATMTTAAIAAGACGTTVTVSATGVLTTDTISKAYNAAPSANPAQLVISAWPTANNVNFQYCNPSAGSITPSAATLNWRVVR
jgi:hypothetical protein